MAGEEQGTAVSVTSQQHPAVVQVVSSVYDRPQESFGDTFSHTGMALVTASHSEHAKVVEKRSMAVTSSSGNEFESRV